MVLLVFCYWPNLTGSLVIRVSYCCTLGDALLRLIFIRLKYILGRVSFVQRRNDIGHRLRVKFAMLLYCGLILTVDKPWRW